jgi:hypothetical protein
LDGTRFVVSVAPAGSCCLTAYCAVRLAGGEIKRGLFISTPNDGAFNILKKERASR